MANLTVTERQQVWRGLMRYISRLNVELGSGVTADELYDGIADTDTWIENNQVNFNLALSETLRNELTQAQKTLLFCTVAAARVDIQKLRLIVGEVD